MPNPFAYPEELRAEGVRLYRQENMSFRKVAAQLGVTAPTVQNWVRKADGDVEADANDDKAEIRRLQKELRRTQQEREILKKAVAFASRRRARTGEHLPVHRSGAGEVPGLDDVSSARGVPVGVLRLVPTPTLAP